MMVRYRATVAFTNAAPSHTSEVDRKIEAPVLCETKRIMGSSSFCGVY